MTAKAMGTMSAPLPVRAQTRQPVSLQWTAEASASGLVTSPVRVSVKGLGTASVLA